MTCDHRRRHLHLRDPRGQRRDLHRHREDAAIRPAQTCQVSGGSGTVGAADVTSVAVNCAVSTYTVGGTVTGLVGTGLVLENNATDDLSVTGNGSFAFAAPVASGAGVLGRDQGAAGRARAGLLGKPGERDGRQRQRHLGGGGLRDQQLPGGGYGDRA